MKKFLKWLLIISVSLAVILFVAFKVLRSQTKKHSPEQLTEYVINGANVSVFYNRPYKKGREIFGKLVPYNQVWRTGANEPTTFTTNKDLVVEGKTLLKGEYTIWTIPSKDKWTVIFNTKKYGWGVRVKDGKPSREEEFDALKIDAPVETNKEIIEQFTITIEEGDYPHLIFEWDTVRVKVNIAQ